MLSGCCGSSFGNRSGSGRTLRSRLEMGRQVHPSRRGGGLTLKRRQGPGLLPATPSFKAIRKTEPRTKELELNQRALRVKAPVLQLKPHSTAAMVSLSDPAQKSLPSETC